MSNFPVVRANSSVCLPRQRDIAKEGVATLTRVTSVPNLSSLYVGNNYQPSTLYPYRRDWNSYDDWYHDKYVANPPLYWNDRRFAARRYAYTDPIPNSLAFGVGYPSFWERYKWYKDWLNPSYWRKHRDPHYDRPLWDTGRMHQLDTCNQKRAIDMYRQGLISFDYLDKKWIEPWALGRKEKDWGDTYPRAGRYGQRRYFYSYA
jgi:hypothetical protein